MRPGSAHGDGVCTITYPPHPCRGGESDCAAFRPVVTSVHNLKVIVFETPPPSDSALPANCQPASANGDLVQRLQQTEERLARLLRGWPGVILTQRADFTIEFASANIKEFTGVSATEWLNQPSRFWQVVHELDAAELVQICKASAQSGAEVTNTFRIRNAVTGRVVYVLERRQPVFDRTQVLTGFEVTWLDVTRQSIAEKRLSTAAWKETLAVLTLGMAHDFRNIMAGIHSLSESYLAQIDKEHAFQEGLSLIKKNSLQASQLVQRMISLHLGQLGERSYHNLNVIVDDLMELVRKIVPRRITVITVPSSDPLPVYVDVVEFRQVLINLLLNASDAMPRGGTLTVRTARHLGPPAEMEGRLPSLRFPCLSLTIEDTGIGIKSRHLSSIFDPFFTTKSKGSGLGLYNARLSVEKHHGTISVQSIEGQGSKFTIWLPEADFEESDRAASALEENLLSRRTILLLGQPGEMLDKAAEFLRSNNYHIVVATAVDSIAELLQSAEYRFAGILLLLEPNDLDASARWAEVCQHKKELKVAMKLSGFNQDDLEGEMLNNADLLLNPDSSDADMLVRLNSVFELK